MMSIYLETIYLLVLAIAAIAADNPCDIQTANLRVVANCSDKKLRYIPFDLPANISILNLNENRISVIGNGTFKKFEVLQELTINDNKLEFLQRNAFDGLQSLEKLQMSGNFLDILVVYSSTLFWPIKNISLLDISRNMKHPNNMNVTVYPDLAFGILFNLERLSVDIMPYPVFGKGFQKMKKLRRLDFNHCYILRMDNSTFANFPSSVEHLEITNCRHFVAADSGALEYFPHLNVLNFENTYIHPIQAFQLLHSLRYRSMLKINFKHINDETIAAYGYSFQLVITRKMMKHLQTICVSDLDLSENNIVDFENGSLVTFEKPECLHILTLSANRFSFSLGYHVDNIKEFFVAAQNLHTFDYSYIPLSFFETTDTRNYPENVSFLKSLGTANAYTPAIILPINLTFLRLTHIMYNGIPKLWVLPPGSKIENIDISYCDSVDWLIVSQGSEIHSLDLSGSDVRYIYKEVKLLSLSKLTSIRMRQSKFYLAYQEDFNIFKYTLGIAKIDISFNYLWDLQEDTFENLTNLQFLNLSNNLFRTVPRAVAIISSLSELDLTSNLLTNIGKPIRDFFDELNSKQGLTLQLHNNAFVCDCTTSDFIWWLHTTNVSLDRNRTYTCLLWNGSESNTYNVAMNFHDHFSSCNSGIWVRIGVTLLVSTFAIIFPFSMIYSYRWQITFYFYRHFRRVLEKGIDVEFKYDVYVFYCEDDYNWVKNVLLPKVEKKWGLKMCIEHRDFSVGKPVTSEIADCIEQSRHIIFLITSSFKHELLGQFAIDRAKYYHFTQNLQKIIVISKEITAEEMPHEFAMLWKDVAVIEWPNNENDLQNFWNKLRLWLFLNRPN